MRTPWLSREYTKSQKVVVKKENKGYILENKELNTSIFLSKDEFNRYEEEKFNEIEWERLFLRGLAIDKNIGEITIEESFVDDNCKYAKSDKVKFFSLNVKGKKFNILINPDIGSWIVLTDEEFERYQCDKLTNDEWISLFIRGLAVSSDEKELELDFPLPAEYPSVIVVNITTGCNLRCKYCFADCGPFKGENMSEEVMDAVIHSMLSMPQVEMITFEFQGGEASTNILGMKKFIEKVENVKDKYNKIIKYRIEINCIIVNDELISLLKKYNVSIGISSDGPKEMTDKSRVDINGKGVTEKIEQGIKKLKESGLTIDGAVCTIGQHNVHYPKQLMDYFDKMKISFKPRPVNILGREKESNLTTKPGEWASCFKGMHSIKDKYDIENFSVHIFEENVYTPIRDYICLRYPCGAARELVSVNPNGDVIPCDGFKGEKDFIMGNVLNETIEQMLNKPAVIKLKNRTYKQIKKCSKCLFRGMCCSCCYSAYGKFGTVYKEDPHCVDKRQIYLYLMQDWIEKNILSEEKKYDKQSVNC
ncbi:MAG: radical SAM protein [Bacilli bacterium]|nr:radical SAM protein [Bacilli bacterium]